MNTTPNSRLSSQPFTIHLPGNDYTIDLDELEKQLDKKLLHKTTWFSPHLKFKSFRGKQLTLINSFKDQRYLLQFIIDPGSLAVSCSCNQPVETLCVHSYRALRDIAHLRGEHYFKQFAPGGWAITALANKKAFVLNDDRLGPIIKPLPPHQKVYGLNSSLSVTENLLQEPATTPSQELLVTYLILSFSRRRTPPILMPCLGTPVKAGNKIKTFLSFPETIAATNAHYFNETQQILNRLCFAMLKETEQLKLNDDWYGPAWQWDQYEQLFNLWQQCWPLLCTQTQVYYSHLYQFKYIRNRPRLRETIPITVSPDEVCPQFVLKKLPDHQRLSMSILHQNKQLRSETGILPFFADCAETDCFYLLPTLAIAQLVSEINDAAPFVSIFKQQHKTFQKNIVAPLVKQGLLKQSINRAGKKQA